MANDLDQVTILQGRLNDDAIGVLTEVEEMLSANPDPALFRIAATACRSLDLLGDARSAEVAAIQAALKNPHLSRAAIAAADGDIASSLEIAKQFLEQHPDDALAMTIAAEAEINLWQLTSAEVRLRTILDRVPNFLRAAILLATCLAKQLRGREACESLQSFLNYNPRNVTALTYLAQLRSEVRDIDETVRIYEQLVTLNPTGVESWVNLAQHYRVAGARDVSIRAFREALRLDPGNGSAWWSLANYFPEELSSEDERQIRCSLPERASSAGQGALHLALGLIADRRQDHELAFRHFAEGKKLRLAHQPYDPEPVSKAVDSLISTITFSFYEERSALGWCERAPIFILGMPRAGTTLVERMLGRHSQNEAAGELPIMQRLSERARQQTGFSDDYAAVLERLPSAHLKNLGRDYVRGSVDYRLTSKPYFVDKNNLNWLHVGLILLALPKAKILDVRRNALDCCWANFKMLFADGFPATNALDHVGRFYSDYARLLDHLRQIAPGRILKVQYESLVDDFEGQSRAIFDFLGQPFEPQCLDFHLSTEAVATASSEQVRRPLNRAGLDRWKPYAAWLGPLIENLAPGDRSPMAGAY